MCVCVCVCVRARARACACVRACVCSFPDLVFLISIADYYCKFKVLILCCKLFFNFLISNFRHVLNIVCILLGISPASDCDLPTLHPAFEDGTDRGFRNVSKSQSDTGEIPKRIHTMFFNLFG
jgi:hypothetical protein